KSASRILDAEVEAEQWDRGMPEQVEKASRSMLEEGSGVTHAHGEGDKTRRGGDRLQLDDARALQHRSVDEVARKRRDLGRFRVRAEDVVGAKLADGALGFARRCAGNPGSLPALHQPEIGADKQLLLPDGAQRLLPSRGNDHLGAVNMFMAERADRRAEV